MGWFNKEEKQVEQITLPDLPELPDLPDVDIGPMTPEEKTLPNLRPTLPDIKPSADSRRLPEIRISPESSQIKQAIIEPSLEEQKIMKKSEFEPITTREDSLQYKIHSPKNEIFPREPAGKKTEPIFIRLDKFETTMNTFEEIKDKVHEIEKLLAKTKDIKEQEQKELDEWERELQIIKARMESIDRDIFNKFD